MTHLPKSEEVGASLKQFLKDLRGTRKLGKRHSLSLMTAAVAYLCLFTLCPLFILTYLSRHYLLGGLETPEDIAAVQNLMETLFPTMGALITPNLIDVSHQNTSANIISTFLLGWSTYELFTGLETVFAKISTAGTSRNFYLSHLLSVVSFIVVFGSGCLFMVLSTASPATFEAIFRLQFEHFPMRLLQPLLATLALLSVVVSLTLIFKMMPTQRIGFINALRGAFLFLLFFIFGRTFFQFYVEFYKTMNQSVYGTFLTGLVMIVWIYYISAIFLFAAQYVIYLEDQAKQNGTASAD